MAAHRAGIGVSANLALGGFDTHDDHDNRHRPSVTALYDTLIALWNEAERQELAEDLVVAVISDFGRTPNYNSAMGKDHWPVTSALLVGKGVVGNRVVGATDEGHKPLEIDVDTLQPVDAGGVRIKPAHVHRALRRVAGIEDTDLDERFPLFVDAGLDLLRA
jgi:hypothetical protein